MEVYHKTASVVRGTARQFTAYVPLSPNTIQWQVNNVPGGNSTVGTVSATGLYTAPAVVPAMNVVTLKAQSTAYPDKFATAAVTITQPVPWVWSSYPSSVTAGAISLSLNGSAFEPGAVASINGVAMPTTYVSSTKVTVAGTFATAGVFALRVTNTGNGAVTSQPVNLTVVAAPTPTPTPTPAPTPTPSPTPTPAPTPTPPPSCNPCATTRIDAGRFLEQAAFGGRPADIAGVQQSGLQAWLNAQYALPESPLVLPSPDPRQIGAMRSWWLWLNTHAADQLRQKVAYALGEIWVVSSNKNNYPEEVLPWMKVLSRNAFGNYKNIIREMTVSPSMGKFLDLARSSKPGVGAGANENYPRELMQLFTIGLQKLNMDGSVVLGANGQPVATYTQEDVKQLSLALTGWAYYQNQYEYFGADMEPREQNHDTSAKSFVGCSLPAGQTTTQDLDGVVNCLFQHPNLPPFVAVRMIRFLTVSNPSPAYVQRVANVFVNNGAGVRGDMKAVVQAILLDTEARQNVATATYGKLREPLFHYISLVRALNGAINQNNGLPYLFVNMGQSILTTPSVFSWFSPLFRIPKTAIFGPEFQIYSPTEAVLRANLISDTLAGQYNGYLSLDLSPFTAVAGDTAKLIDAVDQALLYGRMSAPMRSALTTAINASSDNASRVQTALYLTATSGEYLVMH
ncbi:MAG: DUF1800 family protein [Bryobacterales bacterium]|nr:DUF1800 family protein [Bryobacterales bacterium]